jgi:hypothetical protein
LADKRGKKVEVFDRFLGRKNKILGKIFGKDFFVSEVIFLIK